MTDLPASPLDPHQMDVVERFRRLVNIGLALLEATAHLSASLQRASGAGNLVPYGRELSQLTCELGGQLSRYTAALNVALEYRQRELIADLAREASLVVYDTLLQLTSLVADVQDAAAKSATDGIAAAAAEETRALIQRLTTGSQAGRDPS